MSSMSGLTETALDIGRRAVGELQAHLELMTSDQLRVVYDETAAIRIGDVDYGAWLIARTVKVLARQRLTGLGDSKLAPGEVRQ